MNYRNCDLLNLARLAPCCFGCGRANQGDVVAAHANHVEKGMSLKAPDFAWAALCTLYCHADLDQGKDMSKEDRRAFWERAYWKTQAWLWENGLVCVAAEHVTEDPEPKAKRKVAKGRSIPSRPFQKSSRKIPSRPLRTP